MYEAYEDAGVLEISAECAHTSAPRVLNETLTVLLDLVEHGPSQRELDKAKARLHWQMLELYDMPSELAAFIGLGTLTGVALSPETRSAQLLGVTREQVRSAAERVFRATRSSLVVVGKLGADARQRLRRAQSRLEA
jgi:predicted Zn-dependent peptidase